MQNRLMTALALTAFAFSGSNATAQATTGKPKVTVQQIKQAFTTADTNKNGSLTHAEFRTAMHALFPSHKPNPNAGKGQPAAAKNGTPAKPHTTAFDKADVNHDGKVSQAEFVQFVESRLKQHRSGGGSRASAGTTTAKVKTARRGL